MIIRSLLGIRNIAADRFWHTLWTCLGLLEQHSLPTVSSIHHGSMYARTAVPMEPEATAHTAARHSNPLWLFVKDVGILITMLPYAPNIFLPLRAPDSDDELSLNFATLRDAIFQGMLLVLEIILFIISPLFISFLPGAVSTIVAVLVCRMIYLLCRPTRGSRIVYSKIDFRTESTVAAYHGEHWLFINGCAVNHNSLRRSIDLLAKTFGRPIIGIHNNSYGLIADILECLLQRCFDYHTNGVRVAHSYIRAMLADPTVSKVVLLCHSQGGIVASLVIDRLITTLAFNDLAKLEVYSFGSAASHFSNPCVTRGSNASAASSSKLCPGDLASTGCARHVIRHIEHYANEYDMVPRWGVLHCARDIQAERYAGRVFVRIGASGHMFNQHYLRPMFGAFPDSSSGLGQSHTYFLDQKVCGETTGSLDNSTKAATEFVDKNPIGSILELGNGEQVIAEAPMDGSAKESAAPTTVQGFAPVMLFSRKPTGAVVGMDASLKSVREVSRLWRYLGGGSPD